MLLYSTVEIIYLIILQFLLNECLISSIWDFMSLVMTQMTQKTKLPNLTDFMVPNRMPYIVTQEKGFRYEVL